MIKNYGRCPYSQGKYYISSMFILYYVLCLIIIIHNVPLVHEGTIFSELTILYGIRTPKNGSSICKWHLNFGAKKWNWLESQLWMRRSDSLDYLLLRSAKWKSKSSARHIGLLFWFTRIQLILVTQFPFLRKIQMPFTHAC